MALRVAGTACLNVTLNLYILDYIRKKDYVRNDSTRLALSMVGWTVAPYAGIWLYTTYGPHATYALSATFALILMATFWYFRLTDKNAIQPGKVRAARPLRNVGRFASQPRLRLAWLIAFGRSHSSPNGPPTTSPHHSPVNRNDTTSAANIEWVAISEAELTAYRADSQDKLSTGRPDHGIFKAR